MSYSHYIDPEPLFHHTHKQYKAASTPNTTFANLKKGKLAVTKRINVRGLRVSEARELVLQEIQYTHKQSVYLLIHGKGLKSDGEPVLKHMLQNLFYRHPKVLAYCEAAPHDGGKGAMYLLYH